MAHRCKRVDDLFERMPRQISNIRWFGNVDPIDQSQVQTGVKIVVFFSQELANWATKHNPSEARMASRHLSYVVLHPGMTL